MKATTCACSSSHSLDEELARGCSTALAAAAWTLTGCRRACWQAEKSQKGLCLKQDPGQTEAWTGYVGSCNINYGLVVRWMGEMTVKSACKILKCIFFWTLLREYNMFIPLLACYYLFFVLGLSNFLLGSVPIVSRARLFLHEVLKDLGWDDCERWVAQPTCQHSFPGGNTVWVQWVYVPSWTGDNIVGAWHG